MITLNNKAVIHAATNDELHLKLQDLIEAYHKIQEIMLRKDIIKDDMHHFALYTVRCNNSISEIENIIKESEKYLAEVKLCLAS